MKPGLAAWCLAEPELPVDLYKCYSPELGWHGLVANHQFIF